MIGHRRQSTTRVLSMVTAAMLALSMVATGCAGDDSGAQSSAGDEFDRDAGSPGADSGTSPPDPPPEQEQDFEFSRPATVGDTIFVANSTLNSVAVIDTSSLSISTIPVGFRPTRVVGPEPEHAGADSARAVVLNQGDSTATVIDPESLEPSAHSVLDASNSVAMDPTGRRALFWFASDEQTGGEPTGDLSSISVLKTTASDEASPAVHRVAVGFNIRKVLFDDNGDLALVWTEDGVSRIDLADLDSDTVAPPVPVVPPELAQSIDGPDDVYATDDGRYIAARLPSLDSIVVLDTADEERHLVEFPSQPTDLDLFGDAQPSAWVMLPAQNQAVELTIPDGVERAADATTSEPGSTDPDAGPDAGMLDTGLDAASSDAGSTDPDSGTPTTDWPPGGPLDGVAIHDIDVPGLGAATLNDAEGANDATALLFTTTGDETRVVIFSLADENQQTVALQKRVRGANAAPDADSFVILNQKQPGSIPDDATPGDPEYVARSWGITALDAETGAARLLLTSYEPGPISLWTPGADADGAPTVFAAYDPPTDTSTPGDYAPERRDVIGLNLQTFRHRTYRMPTIPVGLGAIGSNNTVYVDQNHPQGRMTFIEVGTDSTRTVTGYQLNSRIR